MIDEKKLIAETARMYAESLILYGVDVTKQWETATSQRYALERAYMKGKNDAFNKMWIPCSERLPEAYGEYLCCDRYGNIILAMPFKESDSDTGYCAETEGCYMWSCTAWMYLPASFKESED